FTDLAPFGTSTVNIRVRGNTSGNFASSVRLSASNDTNAENDSREVTVEISSAASASASPKGGGGRLEWLVLAVLGGLVTGRRSWTRTPRACRPETTTAR